MAIEREMDDHTVELAVLSGTTTEPTVLVTVTDRIDGTKINMEILPEQALELANDLMASALAALRARK